MTVSSYDSVVTKKGGIFIPTTTFYQLPSDKREHITNAAIEEFFEKGYEKTSIAKIIEKAGIPRGSFYQYFEDKNDLYRYLIIEVIGNRKHQYSSELSIEENRSFLDFLRRLFLNGIQFYQDYPKLASIATEFMTLRNTEIKSRILGDSQKRSDEFFHHYITEKKNSGEISKNIDTETLIYFINGLNQTLATFYQGQGQSFDEANLMSKVDTMISILKNGIEPKEGDKVE